MAYLVYRLGNLPKGWKAKEGLEPNEFLGVLNEFLLTNYDKGWSVRKNGEPIALVFGVLAEFIVIGDVIYHPKASPRDKIGAAAMLFEKVSCIVRSSQEDKSFYERLMDYGILRRVGKLMKGKQTLIEYQSL